MDTYELTELERDAITALREQATAAQKTIEDQQKTLIQLQGAVHGMAMLIARQQGMFTGTETITMSEELHHYYSKQAHTNRLIAR